MYNNSYEDYIRSVLGYPDFNQPDYFQDYNCSNCNMANLYDYNSSTTNEYSENRNSELENCYPEIYKVVYPMVQKACKNMPETVTKEKVDSLVDEIYSNIEGNDQIFLNINLNNNIENNRGIIEEKPQNIKKETQGPRYFNGKKVIDEPQRKIRSLEETPKETRQFNRNLSDLIRILLIRELLGRPNRPGNRPPFPPPGRPPFPPPRPGRPPFNRDWDSNIYEY